MSETNADTANPKAVEAGKVIADVKAVIGHLREGRVMRQEAIDVKQAAERCIIDKDAARSIRNLP